MDSQLRYQDEPHVLEAHAKVTDVGLTEKGPFLVLDQTWFYPQGGGQPSDIGILEVDGIPYQVHFVQMVEGTVRHYGAFPNHLIPGIDVKISIDKDRRHIHSKAHTAGHLIGHIIEQYDPNLIAIKGYHFLDSPYVEFSGETNLDWNENTFTQINSLAKKHLLNSLPIRTIEEPGHLRLVRIGTFPATPCGGTHLTSLNELSFVRATKAKKKKGNLRVSYHFE